MHAFSGDHFPELFGCAQLGKRGKVRPNNKPVARVCAVEKEKQNESSEMVMDRNGSVRDRGNGVGGSDADVFHA